MVPVLKQPTLEGSKAYIKIAPVANNRRKRVPCLHGGINKVPSGLSLTGA